MGSLSCSLSSLLPSLIPPAASCWAEASLVAFPPPPSLIPTPSPSLPPTQEVKGDRREGAVAIETTAPASMCGLLGFFNGNIDWVCHLLTQSMVTHNFRLVGKGWGFHSWGNDLHKKPLNKKFKGGHMWKDY